MEEKKSTLKEVIRESGINEKLNSLTIAQRKKIIITNFVVGLIMLFGNILITSHIRKSKIKEAELKVKQDSLEILSNEIDLMFEQIKIDTTEFNYQ